MSHILINENSLKRLIRENKKYNSLITNHLNTEIREIREKKLFLASYI